MTYLYDNFARENGQEGQDQGTRDGNQNTRNETAQRKLIIKHHYVYNTRLYRYLWKIMKNLFVLYFWFVYKSDILREKNYNHFKGRIKDWPQFTYNLELRRSKGVKENLIARYSFIPYNPLEIVWLVRTTFFRHLWSLGDTRKFFQFFSKYLPCFMYNLIMPIRNLAFILINMSLIKSYLQLKIHLDICRYLPKNKGKEAPFEWLLILSIRVEWNQ